MVFQENVTMVYRDEFTFAWDTLAIWEPDHVAGAWMLGHKAQGHWDDMQGHILMVRDLVGDDMGEYLRNPTDFQEIWRDEGGFGVYDVAFWRPVCPDGRRSYSNIGTHIGI